ncbi:bacillithiol system redox-active protein YtxJ [Ammoniphilus resinae]|uniref:Bacillithiol system protein YtxJ n=1 Tax=Ammoniphilus resinae TaxID=861532 RepID=A0ABS4GLF4_9BACL|nr:bacillithiol system redox-active protein YtxJ [Ammoniphilus resinae]MBP1931069.1 bacillithiol system protein YtxJ [Ammoniphilus resinae]
MAEWKEIHTLDEWSEVIKTSDQDPVLLLKHSTTCPISANAWQECQRFVADDAVPNVNYVIVKVIESRPVSNQIADELAVKHESPQLILINHRKAVWNTSHWSITGDNIGTALSNIK